MNRQAVLFIADIPSWSRYIKFTINNKYYMLGYVVKEEGKFTIVEDAMTDELFTVFTRDVVPLFNIEQDVVVKVEQHI